VAVYLVLWDKGERDIAENMKRVETTNLKKVKVRKDSVDISVAIDIPGGK
jgi:hypothetical protein